MRKLIAWSVLLLLAVAGIWILRPDPQPKPAVLKPSTSLPPPAIETSMPSAPHLEPAIPAPPAAPTTTDEASKPLLIEGLEPTLRADAEGQLILDGEAREALEILICMSARELGQRKQRLVQQLPAVAAAQALDLLQSLSAYRTAAVQMFPPGNPPANIEQLQSMLSSLHQLRVDYLGESTALALFGRGEQNARAFVERLSPPNSSGVTDEARTTNVVHMVFAMFVVPRKPPRAIGQQDP